MTMLRPLAGAIVSLMLLLPGAALADRVIELTPGGNGNAGLIGTGNTDDGGRDTGAADGTRSRQSSSESDRSGRGDSDRSSFEVDSQPTLQTRHFGATFDLSCKVASATDLVLVNRGPDTLPAGTKIKWQLKGENKRGFFAIVGELGGGQSLVADDVLDGQAATTETCIARVI